MRYDNATFMDLLYNLMDIAADSLAQQLHIRQTETNMAKFKNENRYNIDWIRNGLCYRTTMDCPYSYVKNARQIAKALGETINVEYYRTLKYEL